MDKSKQENSIVSYMGKCGNMIVPMMFKIKPDCMTLEDGEIGFDFTIDKKLTVVSGAILGQTEFDVLYSLLKLKSNGSGFLNTSIYRVLTEMGKGTTGNNSKVCINALERLMKCKLTVQSMEGDKIIETSFIKFQRVDNGLIVEFDDVLCPIFEAQVKRVDFEVRKVLLGNITKWMHLYFSLNKAYETDIDVLYSLGGSCSKKNGLSYMVSKGLNQMLDVGYIRGFGFGGGSTIIQVSHQNKG
ncbi:MAG TPA: hypothetical protein VM577_15430 [Anaerovoracaceae bacterium]|nr:hypothetical protein [Anaerovoracaceae bacterium]